MRNGRGRKEENALWDEHENSYLRHVTQRQLQGESNELIAQKQEAAIRSFIGTPDHSDNSWQPNQQSSFIAIPNHVDNSWKSDNQNSCIATPHHSSSSCKPNQHGSCIITTHHWNSAWDPNQQEEIAPQQNHQHPEESFYL